MSASITAEELIKMAAEEYYVIDLRDREAFDKDHIEGAYFFTPEQVEAFCEDKVSNDISSVASGGSGLKLSEIVSSGRKLVVLCRFGRISADAVDLMREAGYDAYNLEGGYGAYVYRLASGAAGDDARRIGIEESITKTFKKDLFSRFTKGIVNYELVQPGDRIAVCISGGKDSMCMAMLFKELQKHHKFPFEVVFLCMDPGYSEVNRKVIESNAKLMGIPLTIFETNIFDAVYSVEKSPCYLCARMRRGYLYSKAKELGCNKIALGHHFDDVIETVLMGMLYSGQFQAMMPKLHSTNFEGMELIRPLYLVREDDIKRWRDYNGLHFIQCACHFTDTCTTCRPEGEGGSKRLAVKQLIVELKKTNPNVENNLLRSTENIPLEKMLGIKINGEKHAFTEYYDVPQDELAGYLNEQIEKHTRK